MRAGGGRAVSRASGVSGVGRRARGALGDVRRAGRGAVADGLRRRRAARRGSTVTVTVTPSSKLRGAKPPDAERSIAGRTYDVGTIVDTRGSGRPQVLVLDRWSVRGVDEEVVAGDGVRDRPGVRRPVLQRERRAALRRPARRRRPVVINRCLPAKDPVQEPGMLSRPATLGEFLSLPNRYERRDDPPLRRRAAGQAGDEPCCPVRPAPASDGDGDAEPVASGDVRDLLTSGAGVLLRPPHLHPPLRARRRPGVPGALGLVVEQRAPRRRASRCGTCGVTGPGVECSSNDASPSRRCSGPCAQAPALRARVRDDVQLPHEPARAGSAAPRA